MEVRGVEMATEAVEQEGNALPESNHENSEVPLPHPPMSGRRLLAQQLIDHDHGLLDVAMASYKQGRQSHGISPSLSTIT